MLVGIDKFFCCWRKVDSDGADVMSAGRLFQTRGPATGKARVSIVDSLNGGTTRWLVLAELRDCRQIGDTNNRSALVGCDPMQNLERYHGDLVDDALRDAQPVQADQRIC